MAEQYLRAAEATIAGIKVTADDLRMRFDTHQALSGTPHHVNIIITNASPKTIAAMRKEKAPVTLKVGYESGSGVIFEGQILQVRNGRENVSDTYVHVLATSSDNGRNYATVNKALAAGHTFRDRVDVALESMKPYGITAGHIDDLGSRKFLRGFSCFGMTHDLLREVCKGVGATWHIQGNKLNILKEGNMLPGGAIVLNSQTGMIGLPEQTIEGVIVRCLLNYNIYPGSKIQINESSIQRAAYSPSTGAAGQNTLFDTGGILGIAADGIYKCWRVEHNGDTRGPNWYTEIACTSGEKPLALSELMLPDDIPGDGGQN